VVGERFGPYELRSLLGRGGMGEVFRAVDTRKARGLVALKRLPAGLAAEPDFQRRFLREAELAARLRDPHVIPIHDYGEIAGQPYLDMRLVDGVDLATHLRRRGPFPPTRAVAILAQLASALDAAHREGLVHRDVKPQNVLVDNPHGNGDLGRHDEDFVYLIDFGIAANLLSSRRSSSVVSGTAAYMAPERFTAGGDHRVDVYALGCVPTSC
jgi:serine/threonine protein kinase, bacterial